ncbi:MAG: CPBP family intramembrane metalloprotease [Ferruginibacter sp.]
MIGILVQLCLSWLIIRLYNNGSLSVLGLYPSRRRLSAFLLFFFVTALICASGFVLKIYVGNQQWRLNPALSASLIFEGFCWNLKSVLFEELIFRGVLLYILIKRLGAARAIIVSAIAFGIYHWFSFGVVGNPVQMIIVFFITGCMGLLLAYGYAKSFSLYIPIAIHLGWNLTQVFSFSGGPIGNGIFIPVGSGDFRTDSYLLFFLVTFSPLILALGINWWLIKKRPQSEPGC